MTETALFFVVVFLEELQRKCEFFFFSFPPSSLGNVEKEEKSCSHPESEPGFEVTAAVTRNVIGAMTTV